MAGLAVLPLTACGFRPLYEQGGAALAIHNNVRVPQIAGRMGYFARERLLRRLGIASPNAQYELDVSITTSAESLAITQTNDITLYNLVGTGTYTLTNVDGESISGTVTGISAYSAPATITTGGSPVAALVAREDAEKRLAEYLGGQVADRVLIAAGQI